MVADKRASGHVAVETPERRNPARESRRLARSFVGMDELDDESDDMEVQTELQTKVWPRGYNLCLFSDHVDSVRRKCVLWPLSFLPLPL